MSEQHTLTIRPRKHTLNVDAVCSCHNWHVRNRSRTDVRAQHLEHIDQFFGAEAQRRRLDEEAD